jgi:MSHA biogenesis protein MshO
MDVARRADMTDIADTALRRITRDVRLALPNSVRVAGGCGGSDTCFLEFLPAPSGGRYRAELDCSGVCSGDVLDFDDATDTSFDVLGSPLTVAAGDQIVVYNLGIPSASGCTSLGADAYEGCNRRTITAGGSTITFTPTTLPFPFDSPGYRFHVISKPVTYACDGAGTLWRYWGYDIQDVQTKTDTIAELDALTGVQKARLATNVSSCKFTYDPNVVAQRSGLVTMRLGITEANPSGGNETVTLYNAAHVSNQP